MSVQVSLFLQIFNRLQI